MAIQLFYWLFVFTRLLFSKSSLKNSSSYSSSLVLCFKNERSNLESNFNAWLSQKNQFDELVFIDDFSTDNSADFIDSKIKTNPTVKLFMPQKDIPGKKQALLTGIKNCKKEVIFLTDADCAPGPNWSVSMSSALKEGIDIVLGFSPYKKEKGLLNTWIRYEALITAFQYLNFALLKIPYMGVGRNLVYRKSHFDKENNIEAHMDIPSGDDDLLISKISSSDNTTVCLDKSSFVYSKPANTLSKYIQQKRRHYSTAHRYKFKHQFMLGLFSLSQILFYLGLLFYAICFSLQLALSIYFIRLIVTWIINYFLCRKLDQKDLIIYWPAVDIILTLYYLYFSFSVLVPSKSTWS